MRLFVYAAFDENKERVEGWNERKIFNNENQLAIIINSSNVFYGSATFE